MWLRFAGRSVRLVVAVALMVAGLVVAGSSSVAAAQSVVDVEVRDQLIADQEALLNVYRCMFGVDAQVVPGGCADGIPVLPAQGPSQFSGIPTAQGISTRDQLIADQEALLNVYRCQFSIDTELVLDGCQDDNTPILPEGNLGPIPPNLWWSQMLELSAFTRACGYYSTDNSAYMDCDNPEDTEYVRQAGNTLWGCDFNKRRGMCSNLGNIWQMIALKSLLACPSSDWFFNNGGRYERAMCYHVDHAAFGSKFSGYTSPSTSLEELREVFRETVEYFQTVHPFD